LFGLEGTLEPALDQSVAFEQGAEELAPDSESVLAKDFERTVAVRSEQGARRPAIARVPGLQGRLDGALGVLDDPVASPLDLGPAAIERLIEVGQRIGEWLSCGPGRLALSGFVSW
jgi:hypothetical protein